MVINIDQWIDLLNTNNNQNHLDIFMHKTDLIDLIAKEINLPKVKVEKTLNSMLKAISKSLKGKSPVTLTGFGTFKVIRTSARKGRNPKNGKEIEIKARNRVSFSAGRSLKELIN